MGIRIQIDAEKRRLIGEASGRVTLEEMRGVIESLRADSRIEPDFSQLFDLSDGDIDLASSSGADFVQAISATVRSARRETATRLALVAPEPHQYGLLRMYEMVNDDTPVSIRVFWTREEADAWLDSPA